MTNAMTTAISNTRKPTQLNSTSQVVRKVSRPSPERTLRIAVVIIHANPTSDAMKVSPQPSRESDDSRWRWRDAEGGWGIWMPSRMDLTGGLLRGRLGGPCPGVVTCFHGPPVGFASAGAGDIGPLCLAEGGGATSLGQLQCVSHR